MPWYTVFVIVRQTWVQYAAICKSHPLCTQGATSSLSMVIGDRIAQASQGDSSRSRTASMALWSAFVAAPSYMAWSRLVESAAGRGRTHAAAKAVARQLIATPVVLSCICWTAVIGSVFMMQPTKEEDELHAVTAEVRPVCDSHFTPTGFTPVFLPRRSIENVLKI
jgi:hypothetical protein